MDLIQGLNLCKKKPCCIPKVLCSFWQGRGPGKQSPDTSCRVAREEKMLRLGIYLQLPLQTKQPKK